MILKAIMDSTSLDYTVLCENSTEDISAIVLSSREAGPGTIFTAIKGYKTDGHKYLADAFARGCRNFIVEEGSFISDQIGSASTALQVRNPRKALALVSNLLYDKPFDKLNMTGITGTKGKTTVTTLLHHFLKQAGQASMFSTIKYQIGATVCRSERTTMEANQLQKLLADSAAEGDNSAVVEVSSHGVTLHRIEGINWDRAIFTSFSRDHLDLYGTMEKYFDAKLEFFRMLNRSNKKDKKAFINIDDPKGPEVCRVLDKTVQVFTIGSADNADYRIGNKSISNGYPVFTVTKEDRSYQIKSPLPGDFNITNITLAFAAALEAGVDPDRILASLDDFEGVEGRFEVITEKPFRVIVDYAHSPQSLEKILDETRMITEGKMILVFGCTGDRDKEKRSIMGKIASQKADLTFITDDDPYTEEPAVIAQMVEEGFKNGQESSYRIILDRKSAIKEALLIAGPQDTVLLAGMGHEKVQIRAQGPVPHNDKEEALKILAAL